MFSSGFFIMICTILRAYYSLASITSLPIALGWASRECFVAAIVASLPGIKPLFRNTKILGSSNRKKSHNYYNSQGMTHNPLYNAQYQIVSTEAFKDVDKNINTSGSASITVSCCN